MLIFRSILLFVITNALVSQLSSSADTVETLSQQGKRRLNFYSDFFSTSASSQSAAARQHHSNQDNSRFISQSSDLLQTDTTKTSVAEYSIKNMNFSAAKVELDNLLHLIKYRFNLDNKYRAQLFNVAANMNTNAWDIMKYKLASKLVAEDAANRSFLMIFGGSSVTAGHDNYFRESYPIVFERRMVPAFRALGINLIVHNIAQGSNDCFPYNFCYEAMGGENPDWIGWEQSYNCGRDNGVFEMIARVAAWNKAVMHYSASGGFIPETCKSSKDAVPWISEKWTPQLVNITNVQHMTAKDVSNKRSDLDEWYNDGNSVGKFTGALTESFYQSVGAHGFNLFGNSRSRCFNDETNRTGCNALDVRGKCQHEGGPNWQTLEAAKFTATSNGKKWHPSAGMHLMRGEVIAHNYAYILLDAIYKVEEDMKTHSASDLSSTYKAKLEFLQPSIGKPRFCDKVCEERPICYTDFEPNYNPARKLNKVLLLPAKNDEKHWNRVQFKKDVPGLANQNYGWLDRRPLYESSGFNSSIYVQLQVRHHSIALVCGYPVKESLKHAIFYLDQNVTVPPGQLYTPTANVVRWTKRKYFNNECTMIKELMKGDHVLTIKMAQDRGVSSLSHVVLY